MKNRSYMLPYYYKKVGWIMLVCTPVFFVLGLLAFRWELIANMHSRYLTMILYMMLFAGIFMVVLSEEKEEDEMIIEPEEDDARLGQDTVRTGHHNGKQCPKHVDEVCEVE